MRAQRAARPRGRSPGGAPRKGERHKRRDNRSSTNGSGPAGRQTGSGGKLEYGECPLCGKLKLDVTPDPSGNEYRPCHVGCWICCPPKSSPKERGEFIRALAAVIDDCPNGSALLADPLRYLARCFNGPGRRVVTADEAPPPSAAHAKGWHSRLFDENSVGLAYLLERGFTREVIRAARIGWNDDKQVLTFPMWRDGELVACKTRKPRDKAKMINLAGTGRAWPLYPEPQYEERWTLLVEGELDALRARSVGLPATSITLGAGTSLRDEWVEDLAGLRVAVCFDVGAEVAARRAVARLREAGIRARWLDLRSLDMTEEGDDLSTYLNGGGSVSTLRRAARGRRRAKEAA